MFSFLPPDSRVPYADMLLQTAGGLADVMGALPKALSGRGHRVMVISPRYANYEDAWDTSVRMTYNVFGTDHEVRP